MTNEINDRSDKIDTQGDGKPAQFGNYADQSLTSYNQTGAMQIKPSAKTLSSADLERLATNLSREAPVQVLVATHDRATTLFARQIVDALAKAEFKVDGLVHVTPPSPPPPGVHLDRPNNRIIVGPPA